MSDVTAAPSTIERARALFAAEQLPFPPLSERFAAALREENPHLFATRSLEAGPYNLEIYSLEIEQESAVPDYAVVGFDGHGINSWAVHYYVVEGALALFIQLPWGGAYVDADEGGRTVTAAFTWAGKLQADVRRARQQGLIPEGWRLLVVASEFATAGWAWVGHRVRLRRHRPEGGNGLRTPQVQRQCVAWSGCRTCRSTALAGSRLCTRAPAR